MGQSKFSYELKFWFISIENGGKQKSKIDSSNQSFCDGLRNAMDKMCGVKLPHPLLEKEG